MNGKPLKINDPDKPPMILDPEDFSLWETRWVSADELLEKTDLRFLECIRMKAEDVEHQVAATIKRYEVGRVAGSEGMFLRRVRQARNQLRSDGSSDEADVAREDQAKKAYETF